MNPSLLIGNRYHVCRLTKTKGGLIYNPIFHIEFKSNGETDSEIYRWMPFGNGGISIAIVNDSGWQPVYTFSSDYDGDPLGMRVDNLESVVLLPYNSIETHKEWEFIRRHKSYEWKSVPLSNRIFALTENIAIDDAIFKGEEVLQRAKLALVFTGQKQKQFDMVSPIGTGGFKLKTIPHVTVAIPHLNTIEPLKVAIECWRNQTIRPYIIIVDTGSCPDVCDVLELMRAEDLEIHYIKSGGYHNSSAPVTAALDLAQSICTSEYLFHTHSDVFPRRDDLLENWIAIVNDINPVAGYKMSPREWVSKEPEWMVGHTALMLYMPKIHRIGATWSFARINALGYPYENIGNGWPDTEIAFNWSLKIAGVKPIFLGFDVNFKRTKDDNIDHVRSYAGSKIYGNDHFQKAEGWMKTAIAEAKERVSLTIAKRLRHVHPSHLNRKNLESDYSDSLVQIPSPRREHLHRAESSGQDRDAGPSQPCKSVRPLDQATPLKFDPSCRPSTPDKASCPESNTSECKAP